VSDTAVARLVSVAVCLTALAACGGTASAPPSSQPDRQWVANASDVIGELERDVALSTGGGATLADARAALRDTSSLYTVLVAYTDFGGCNHMLAAVGEPGQRFAKVARTLGAACAGFQRAATLFTRATSASDAHALLAATRLALRTSPLLARARAELQAASSRRIS
jgi:hypothetical protein